MSISEIDELAKRVRSEFSWIALEDKDRIADLASAIATLDELIDIGEVHLNHLATISKIEELVETQSVPMDLCNELRTRPAFSSKFERQARTLELLFDKSIYLVGSMSEPDIQLVAPDIVRAYWEECGLTWLINRTSLHLPAIKVTAIVVSPKKKPEARYFRHSTSLLEFTRSIIKNSEGCL